MRTATIDEHAHIYPPYNVFSTTCKRNKTKMVVWKKKSPKNLPARLDHTALRMIEQQKEEVDTQTESPEDEEPIFFNLTCKWGVDGSSGHSEDSQRFKSTDPSDTSLFCATLVPLQLQWKWHCYYWRNNSELAHSEIYTKTDLFVSNNILEN